MTKTKNLNKVLILNGSPHANGDTAYILDQLKKRLPQDTIIEELSLYKSNMKPCVDCRHCWKNEGCPIKDDMDIMWKDDYNLVVVASPVYMYNVTPPLFTLVTRLNMKYSSFFILSKKNMSFWHKIENIDKVTKKKKDCKPRPSIKNHR